jgi:hypothetical protein
MTRAEFLGAARVLEEGRPAHSLYAIEDAKAAMKPIARYYWRQASVVAFCVITGGLTISSALPNWPWLAAYFVTATAGSLASFAMITLPPLRSVFVPAGFRAGDVSKAAYHVLA